MFPSRPLLRALRVTRLDWFAGALLVDCSVPKPPLILFRRDPITVDSPDPLPFLSDLKWNDEGLIPAIVQDAENGDVADDGLDG